MAYTKQKKGIDFGNTKNSDVFTRSGATNWVNAKTQSGRHKQMYGHGGNPGDKWNETWATPNFASPEITLSRYGLDKSDLDRRSARGGDISHLGEYSQDLVRNRDEILVNRKLNRLAKTESSWEDIKGEALTTRQRRRLGAGGPKAGRQKKRIQRKADRQARKALRRANK
tara:strand:+ start:170 stop:679 length:510 start_codon:yes stop_codon:yes gene_type:complete